MRRTLRKKAFTSRTEGSQGDGFRIHEIVAMAWRNLDFDHLVIADLVACGGRALDDAPRSWGWGKHGQRVLADRIVGERSLATDGVPAGAASGRRRGDRGGNDSAESQPDGCG